MSKLIAGFIAAVIVAFTFIFLNQFLALYTAIGIGTVILLALILLLYSLNIIRFVGSPH